MHYSELNFNLFCMQCTCRQDSWKAEAEQCICHILDLLQNSAWQGPRGLTDGLSLSNFFFFYDRHMSKRLPMLPSHLPPNASAGFRGRWPKFPWGCSLWCDISRPNIRLPDSLCHDNEKDLHWVLYIQFCVICVRPLQSHGLTNTDTFIWANVYPERCTPTICFSDSNKKQTNKWGQTINQNVKNKNKTVQCTHAPL